MISAPDAPKLRIAKFVARDAHYHVARHTRGPGHATGEHTHDFPELFWLERGRAIHQINGQPKELRPGDLVLIRPPDRHGFRAPAVRQGDTAFVMVNVAFRNATLLHLRKRYYAGRTEAFPWRGAELPARFRMGADDLRRLADAAERLARGPQSRLRLEHFLLEVLESIERTAPVGSEQPSELPDWLRGALAVFAQPKHLSGGVRELARLAGRGPEHINRVIRRGLGQTSTDLVNRLRLDYAARELAMSGKPIVDIALDAGFDNLSYFYRLFQRRFGHTPRQFRLQGPLPAFQSTPNQSHK